MKRITKLSLVASLALISTQAFSADTIAQAFADGKVSGEIKSQYFQKEVGTAHDKASIWTNGGNLSFVTDSYNGLKAGVTFQVATVTSDDLADAPTTYNADQNVSGAIASEAYLEYALNNTTTKIGRQYISTPLIAGSGSRIFKESFEGIVVSNTDIPNTTLVGAYVSKEQYRTDVASGGSNVKAVSGFIDKDTKDGVYSLYVKNKSVENLTLQAQYALINSNTAGTDDTKSLYADATYNFNPFTIGLQTYQTDNGNATNSRGKEYGIMISTKLDKLSLYAAYTIIDKKAAIAKGIGNGADKIYTGAWIYGGRYTADTDAYRLEGSYAITNDLSFGIRHAAWKEGNADRVSETDLITSYKFDKNLSATFVYADYDKIPTESYRSRLYVSYKF